jgi:hypothetical protein
VTAIKEGYSDKYEEQKRHWGGGIMGAKAQAKVGKFIAYKPSFHARIIYSVCDSATDMIFFIIQPRNRRPWTLLLRFKQFVKCLFVGSEIKIKKRALDFWGNGKALFVFYGCIWAFDSFTLFSNWRFVTS